MAEKTSMAVSLRRELFADEKANVFTVLDGASVPGLLEKLEEDSPEHVCLFTGQDDPELAETAPYLVRLDAKNPFTNWVLENGWDKHWGIFAAVPAEVPFRDVRKHFRSFLRVRDPEGKMFLFRYYDPRVLRVYLPTCNAKELQTVFGPVGILMLESEQTAELRRFSLSEGALVAQKVVLVG